MNRIVLDLEFTKIEDREIRRICKEEVIQIGAVKLNSNNELVSRFNAYIKPAHTEVSKKVEKLTHISNKMLENCVYFKEAFDDFLNWIGTEEYAVVSWSESDLIVLREEVALEEINDERVETMFTHWIDAQVMVSELIGISQNLSLSTALGAINANFDGQAHSALDDAENTAKIVTLMDDKKAFDKVMAPIKELFAPKEDLTYTLGAVFGDFLISA